MSEKQLGKPRPLWRVILLSVVSLMLYYGWYKWILQEELRRYKARGLPKGFSDIWKIKR